MTELVRAAEYRGLTTYQDIAVIMGLPLHGMHMGQEIGHLLGEISEDESLAGRPMLSAVVVGVSGKPGPGFFSLARQLEKFTGTESEDDSYWNRELQSVYQAWRRPLRKDAYELNREFEEALKGVAASEHKSAQDLCREVVEGFLRQRLAQARTPEADRYSAMRKLIGMVKEGPTDASIHHDWRVGEKP